MGTRLLLELNTLSAYIDDHTEFIVAFGNNEFRWKWLSEIERAGTNFETRIHPTAYVSPKAVSSLGNVVLPKAVVNTSLTMNHGCIINLEAIIDYDCVTEEGVHICLGAIVKGENRILRCEKVEARQLSS